MHVRGGAGLPDILFGIFPLGGLLLEHAYDGAGEGWGSRNRDESVKTENAEYLSVFYTDRVCVGNVFVVSTTEPEIAVVEFQFQRIG